MNESFSVASVYQFCFGQPMTDEHYIDLPSSEKLAVVNSIIESQIWLQDYTQDQLLAEQYRIWVFTGKAPVEGQLSLFGAGS